MDHLNQQDHPFCIHRLKLLFMQIWGTDYKDIAWSLEALQKPHRNTTKPMGLNRTNIKGREQKAEKENWKEGQFSPSESKYTKEGSQSLLRAPER